MSKDPAMVETQRLIKKMMSTITPGTSQVIGDLVVWLSITTMIKLKQPVEVILSYHNYCGAADSMGISEETIRATYAEWRQKIITCYPTIPVTVIHEKHSECGRQHHGHFSMVA